MTIPTNKILRLSLLGSPQVLLDDHPLTSSFATNKAQALLFYLAVTGQPHSRDSIAALLWDNMTDAQAKKNLRTVLSDLRGLLGDYLQIDRQTLAFDPTRPYWLDVEILRRDLTLSAPAPDSATRQAAVALYQDEFLSGFHIHNAPGFDGWVVEQREHLHALVAAALSVLVQEYSQQDNYPAALAANRRLLALDAWSEPAHRRQMFLLAQTGERSAALAQYESCRRILQEEFGVEPLPETAALYQQIRDGLLPGAASTPQTVSLPSPQAEKRRLIGHSLPHPTKLYGRDGEMAHLQKWIVRDGCRLVGIFGMGGLGKSQLAATFARSVADSLRESQPTGRAPFQRVLWHSLLNAPPLAELLQEWIAILSDQAVTRLPDTLDRQLSQLLDYLRQRPALMVLDNLESILQTDERSGFYRPGYEAYGQLIRMLAESEHASSMLLTSREWPQELIHLEEDSPAVRFLPLAGLSDEAGRQMIGARGVAGDPALLSDLAQHYSGNPLALKLISETVQSLFGGNITAFLQSDTRIFDDIQDVLDQQFARLTGLEQELLLWLAIVREPIPYSTLRAHLAHPPAARLSLEAMRSLQRRSLLEQYDETVGLQNVVMEYCTEWLIAAIVKELLDESPVTQSSIPPITHSFLHRHALILAQSKEYVRASQTRLLLAPVAERLVARLGSRGAEEQLAAVLARLHTARPVPGYAAANLLHLLLHLGAALAGADFSRLYLRQLYLRGISLPRTNFAQAEIVDSVFSEPFGLVYTALFSPDGRFLAAGTSEGDIYLWRTADQQLAQVIQAHTLTVNEVAFGERETATGETQLVLVSASNDKTIGLWPLTSLGGVGNSTHLRHEDQQAMLAVSYHPERQRVVGVGADGEIFVWGLSPDQLPRLSHRISTHPLRLRLIAFDASGEIVAVGNRKGAAQLRRVETGEAGALLQGTAQAFTSVALDPAGTLLATGTPEGGLSLWTLPGGELQQSVETKAGSIDALGFSPDGRLLASSHGDYAIRLWSVDRQLSQPARLHLRHTLRGHSQIIWSVTFGPGPVADGSGDRARQLLTSGSSDQTVRVWDAETGQSLYTLTGQPRALSSLVICPPPQADRQADEWQLAVVGYDRLVHLWQGRGSQTDAIRPSLPSRRGPLYAVAISPDGRTLACGGDDGALDLWEIDTNRLRQTLAGHTKAVLSIAFHPQGKLLASGGADGTVRLWDVGAGEKGSHAQPVGILQANPRYVYAIAFSPDGHRLAVAGTELSLRQWDMTQPDYPEVVTARKVVQAAGEQDIYSVAFSPDGAQVACGGNSLIHLWQGERPPLILRGHAAWIYSLAFSPDSALLASSSGDRTVRLWDTADGRLRAVLSGHSETVYKVAFAPGGDFVVSCSFDGSIRFWDVQTGACVNVLRVEGPYAGMNIAGVTGISDAQKAALKALGAVEG